MPENKNDKKCIYIYKPQFGRLTVIPSQTRKHFLGIKA